MFTFNVSGSSSQGRSSPKPNYVPSTFIAKQLAIEEEARRQKGLNSQKDNSSHSSFQADISEEWPTRDEVLAPGYNAGPLGYEIPKQSLRSNFSSQHVLNESTQLQESRFDNGAGVGLGDSNQFTTSRSRSLSNAGLRLNTSVDSSTDQSNSIGAGSTGISRSNRPEFNLDDIQRRNSVRFSTAAPELVTPRPQTPSIFNQNSASPFFSNAHSSSNSGMSNLQSALKGEGKVDVLSHRGATGAPSLNSSLGPALGSVSGVSLPTQPYTSPKLMNSELNTASMRSNAISGNNAAGSSFFLNLDNGSMRQNPVHQNNHGKGPRNEDEEDKDKERYMPAILLRTASGLKGSKIEPFVDGTSGKTEWDSDSFQQSGPGREGNTRLAPHLMGDDAPPSDTLRDIAQKEKYYTTTLPQLATTNSRFNSGDLLNGEGSGDSQSIPKVDDGFDSIITYGFPPEATSYMLNQFRAFGTIAKCESGSYGQVASESFNWLKIQYRGTWAARNATSRHLQSVGKFIVGVHACQSFTNRPHHGDTSMDITVDGGQGSGSIGQLSDSETREIEEGVIKLLKMRAQGLSSGSSNTRLGGQMEATKARHASLSESWNHGNAGLNTSQSSTSSMGFSPTRTLNDSTSSNVVRPSGLDQEDEEMAFILGRSLTSGGLARPGRGRGFEREKGEFSRSRSNDQLRHGQDQESSRNAVDGGILAESQTIETESVGFRPLFGQSESRGLSGLGQSSSQFQQQQQQQQQPQPNQFFEQRQFSDVLSGSQQNHMSLRRPNLGNSVASDTTLFASSGGMLLDASSSNNDHYGGGSSSSSPYHVQKKQRLSSSLFASSGSGLSSMSSSTSSNGNIPQSQFGRGRDRSSILIDDPSQVDQWGTPLMNKMSQSTPSTTASSSATLTKSSAARGDNPNTTGQHITAGPESMISSVINMAKKRLFWG
ncbi:hypothetical protein BGZ76_003772 [Entomortierella beljakovae]|nr:hypothetical protein BGZ76_003772 [Entomortierella beljakovae]